MVFWFFMSLMAIGFKDITDCDTKLHVWLAVQCFITTFEQLLQEFRERITNSTYWEDRRTMLNVLKNSSTLLGEALHLGWWIYGQFVYYSPEAYECSDSDSELMDFMSILLLLQTFKVILFGLALLVVALYVCCKYRKDSHARDQSKGIIRSLVAMKYHSLV